VRWLGWLHIVLPKLLLQNFRWLGSFTVQKNDAENDSLYKKTEDATMYGRNYVSNYNDWTIWLKGGRFRHTSAGEGYIKVQERGAISPRWRAVNRFGPHN
jgi:hypothetical protein